MGLFNPLADNFTKIKIPRLLAKRIDYPFGRAVQKKFSNLVSVSFSHSQLIVFQSVKLRINPEINTNKANSLRFNGLALFNLLSAYLIYHQTGNKYDGEPKSAPDYYPFS